jgi:hypothetical protein
MQREAGVDWPVIAISLGRLEKDVRHGLATVRTHRSNPTRATLNISPAAMEEIKKLQHPGEPMWETVNRLVGVT